MDIRARDIMTREVLVVKAEDKDGKSARICWKTRSAVYPWLMKKIGNRYNQ